MKKLPSEKKYSQNITLHIRLHLLSKTTLRSLNPKSIQLPTAERTAPLLQNKKSETVA